MVIQLLGNVLQYLRIHRCMVISRIDKLHIRPLKLLQKGPHTENGRLGRKNFGWIMIGWVCCVAAPDAFEADVTGTARHDWQDRRYGMPLLEHIELLPLKRPAEIYIKNDGHTRLEKLIGKPKQHIIGDPLSVYGMLNQCL